MIVFNLLLAVAMALATWVCGWWGVALIALVIGAIFHTQGGRAWWAALAASESWVALLVLDALTGPFGRVASTLGGSMNIPAGALLMVTLLFPALLAWSAAMVAAEARNVLEKA